MRRQARIRGRRLAGAVRQLAGLAAKHEARLAWMAESAGWAAARLQRWARRQRAGRVDEGQLVRRAAGATVPAEVVRAARWCRQRRLLACGSDTLIPSVLWDLRALCAREAAEAAGAILARQVAAAAATAMQRAWRRRTAGQRLADRLASLAGLMRRARQVQRWWRRARHSRGKQLPRATLAAMEARALAAERRACDAEADLASWEEQEAVQHAYVTHQLAAAETAATSALQEVSAMEQALEARAAAWAMERAACEARILQLEGQLAEALRAQSPPARPLLRKAQREVGARVLQAAVAELEAELEASVAEPAREAATASAMPAAVETRAAETQTETDAGASKVELRPAQAEMVARAERAAVRIEQLAAEAERRAAEHREHAQVATRTGGRQVRKARIRAQAAAADCTVVDWMQVREAQQRLMEAVGGGELAPQRLEERLERARERYAQQQGLLR